MRLVLTVLALAAFTALVAGEAGAAPRLVVHEQFTNTG
jgi:hypothetical protein